MKKFLIFLFPLFFIAGLKAQNQSVIGDNIIELHGDSSIEKNRIKERESRKNEYSKYLQQKEERQKGIGLNKKLNLGGDGNFSNVREISKVEDASLLKSSLTAVSKTINCTAGSLSTLLTAAELSTVTDLTITGTIDARDFKTMRDNMPLLSVLDISSVIILEYTGSSGTFGTNNVLYPANEIPDYSFYNLSTSVAKLSLSTIKLPSSIIIIGQDAFYGCSGLVGNLLIPSSVTIIKKNAFMGCRGFTGSLIIPNSVTIIDDNAFRDCNGFNGNLIIGSSVKIIGNNSFEKCTNFTGLLTIPTSVTTIGSNAFGYCSGFNGNLTIGSSVTSIGTGAFYNCNKFAGSLVIPSSVTNIGDFAFNNCNGFDGTLTIGSSVISIGINAFADCNKFKGSLVIPSSVTNIGDYAFFSCYGFNGTLTIGSSVTNIGVESFGFCSNFTGSLIIPSSVLTIGDNAFRDCNGFNGTLTIGSAVTSIGDCAFYSCGFNGSLVLPPSITFIGDNAFCYCGFNGTLTLPENISKIGIGTFGYCNFTGSLIIPSTVTFIGDNAFCYCEFNGQLSLGNSVASIGKEAFYKCKNIIGVITIPSSMTEIKENTFSGCSSITSISIPQTIVSIDDYAFGACGGNISVDASNANYSSNDGVLFSKEKTKLIFCPSSKTDSYNIPTTVTKIASSAFWRCKMNTIYIPSSVALIDNNPFQVFEGLINVDLENANFLSKDGVLYNKTQSTLLACPSSIKGAYTIPSSVNTINFTSFTSCAELSTITIPSSITNINSYAFCNCNGLKSIYSCASSPANLSSSVFLGVNKTNCTLFVPSGSKSAYQAAEQWKDFTNIVEMNGFLVSSSTENLSMNGGNATINVITNEAWTATSNQPWLTVTPTSGTGNATLTFTATANTSLEPRTAIVTISATGFTPQTITVTQQGIASTLTLSKSSINIQKEASSSASFDVTSNTSWTASSNQAWLTVSTVAGTGNGTINLTAEANTANTERIALVTVSATGVTSQTVTVTQAGNTTGIEIDKESSIIVSPNPTSGEFFINGFEGNAKIYVYDINGKLYKQKDIVAGESVSVNELSQGVYILKIDTLGGQIQRKLVKR